MSALLFWYNWKFMKHQLDSLVRPSTFFKIKFITVFISKILGDRSKQKWQQCLSSTKEILI